MTKYEAVVVSAYTSRLIGNFSECHNFIEQILERHVWTHELASEEVWEQIKVKS